MKCAFVGARIIARFMALAIVIPGQAATVAPGDMTRVSVDSNGVQANGPSSHPSISASGRYVVFGSNASNLVAGDTNNQVDVFVRDLQAARTSLVSVAADGGLANEGSNSYSSISDDGRYVVFESGASNLVAGDSNGRLDVFVRDLQTGITSLVSVAAPDLQQL